MPDKSAVNPSTERAERATLVGLVTSDKMEKTITVSVERIVQHPHYGKYMKQESTCYAHDEKGEAKTGDRVEIMSTRPLSRLKRWRLIRVVEKSAITQEEPAAPKPAAPKAGGKAPAKAPAKASAKSAAPKKGSPKG